MKTSPDAPRSPAVLLLAIALLTSRPAGAGADSLHFGPVGVVFVRQAIQVNLTHVGNPGQVPSDPACQAHAQFFDLTGSRLKSIERSIAPGQTTSVRLSATDFASRPEGKTPVRAEVTWQDTELSGICRASLEVVDIATGRTVLVGIGNARPGPFAISGTLGVAQGQALRLTGVNLGSPEQSACNVALAAFDAPGTLLAQRNVSLTSGEGAHLDAAPVTPRGVRAMARGVPLRLTGSLCRQFLFSVEVYDTTTGISTLLWENPGIAKEQDGEGTRTASRESEPTTAAAHLSVVCSSSAAVRKPEDGCQEGSRPDESARPLPPRPPSQELLGGLRRDEPAVQERLIR
jgi:hypothetical protein